MRSRYLFSYLCVFFFFFCSSRGGHTRCALVTGVQTCALPIAFIIGAVEPAPQQRNVAEIVDLRRRPHVEAVFRRDFAGEEAAVRTILADAFAVDAGRRGLELRLLGPIARQVEIEPPEADGQAVVDPQIDP